MGLIARGGERWTLRGGELLNAAGQREILVAGPSLAGGEEIVVARESQLQGAVEAFAQERQAVLDAINLYGDETLHKALDSIGWPANYTGGQ